MNGKTPETGDLTPEQIAKQQEALRKQREAAELLGKKEEEGIARTWSTEAERNAGADQVARMIKPEMSSQPVGLGQIESQPPISDTTQRFVERFEDSKSPEESKRIMNEVLRASASGKIRPDEASEILARANLNRAA